MGSTTSRVPGVVLAAVGVVAMASALAGLAGRATFGARLTADEPYYLLTAESLVADGSLDIADELEARTYLPYHELTINQQTREVGGRRVAPHDPLLPALVALPMALGGWVAAKATLAAIAGLLAALTTWVAAARFGVAPRVAAAVVGAGAVGVPLAPYGTQVYPELPAALATMAAFAAVTARSGRRSGAAAVVAIVALPWLSVKYVPVAAVAALGLVWTRRRDGVGPTAVVGPLAALAGAGIVYLAAHQVLYGGWTVYAAGDHFVHTGEFSVVGTRVDVLGRSRRLVGLLVDRDFGLVAWHPLWLLAAPAVAAMVRRRPPGTPLLVALVTAGWANASFVALTMHGFWFPGRQVVVVVPLILVALAVAVDRARVLLGPVVALGVVGAATWLHVAWEAATGRRTLVVDFAETAAPWHRLASVVLPDGQRAAAVDDVVLGVWTVVLAAASVAGWRLGGRSGRGDGSDRGDQDPFAGEGADADHVTMDVDGGGAVG